MPDNGLMSVLRHVHKMVHAGPGPDLGDRELLARFLSRHEDAAFTALVERHGPMVLAVCRRVLRHPQDAEDACQATFLVLARSASAIRKHTSLASWLHGVAYRLARKLKDSNMRRLRREASAAATARASSGAEAEASWREVQAFLDEELSRLPEKLRAPLVACYLEGLSRQEAAQRLGLPLPTVRGRLGQARERLRQRLARRGVTLTAALVVPALAEGEAATGAALPPTLVVVTTRTARAFAARQAASSPAVTLARGWFLTMLATRCKIAIAVLLAFAVLAAGAGLAALQTPPEPATAGAAQPMKNGPPAATGKGRLDAFGDPLPAGSTMRLGTARYRQGTVIDTLAVSADGKIALASSGGHIHGAVRVFDLLTGLVRHTLIAPGRGSDAAIAVSPDGRLLATKIDDSGISLFDAATGKELRKLPLPKPDTPYGVSCLLAFSPDGKTLAARALLAVEGNKDVLETAIHLIEVDTGAVLQTLRHKDMVYAIAFSPDGKRVATGGHDRNNNDYFGRIWDVATGKELRRFANGNASLRALAFSPDGKTLAGGGDDARLRLWNVETGKVERLFPADGYRICSVAYAPDGQTVAAAGDSLRLYDTATGKERLRIELQAVGLSFSADGKVLTGAVMGAIYRWDAATGKLLTPVAGDSCVDHLLVSSDGRLIVTGGQDGDAHLWDGRTGAHLKRLKASWQRGIALSPDGRFLVWPVDDPTVTFKVPGEPGTIYNGSRLRLYDIAKDQFIERFAAFKGAPHDLAFTADGKTLITVDRVNCMIRLWDLASGKELRSFSAAPKADGKAGHFLWKACVSPDGKTLAAAYERDNDTGLFGAYSVRLWDMATGKQLHELDGHFGYVEGLAFSPDSRFLMTGSQALSGFAQNRMNQPMNQLYVWDVPSGKRVPALPNGLPDGANCIAYAPDGRTVATANENGTIKIWEVATWKVRTELRGHRDRINALTFMPDGRLLSGGVDTTVLIWDMRTGK